MRIVIAEDAVLLREGISRLLTDSGHDVVASVGNGIDLLHAASALAPQLAIVDVRMPPTFTDEGIQAAIRMRQSHPAVKVLVLSQYVEERYATELVSDDSGGLGYLLKDRVVDVEDFLRAIETVAAGGTVLDPEVVSQLFVRTRRQDGLYALSEREREVLQLMAQGQSNSAIANSLFLSAGAIEKHISAIFNKLGLAHDSNENRRVLAVVKFLES